MGTKWLIATATTTYGTAFKEANPWESDRPELADVLLEFRDLFEGLGFEYAPGFSPNMTRDAFRDTLRSFLTSEERDKDDTVVVYYTGHGIVDTDELFFPMADATADVVYTSLEARDLTGRLLRGSRVQRLLYVLDTCYSGSGVSDLGAEALAFLSGVRAPDGTASIGIVVASRPSQQVESGVFTRALADSIRHRSSAGTDVRHIPLDALVNLINERTPDWQRAQFFHIGEGLDEFIPNPRYDDWFQGLDVRSRAEESVRARREAERRDHVLPRAQGLDEASRDDLWLFEGRHAALADIVRWLESPPTVESPSTMIVTGAPGSGKSAVLARLAVLADDRPRRGRIPSLDQLPLDTIPKPGTIKRFIHARGLTASEVMAGICEAAEVEFTTSPGRLLSTLASRGGPTFTIVVDAVDEALGEKKDESAGHFPVVEQVLEPLIRGCGRTPFRLLIGTRSHLLPRLGNPTQRTDLASLIDLDDERHADPSSVRRYVEKCLLELSISSRYRFSERPLIEAVTEAVAAAAGKSFLVALITSRSLALTPLVANPWDPAWRASLPTRAADAMQADLDRRLGAKADKARDLLLPLAFAQGAGLPWENLWLRVANALSGLDYTQEDLEWLFDEAGYYIVEATSDDGRRSVYRLYHESLAEHLRARRVASGFDIDSDHVKILECLSKLVPNLLDGHPDWKRAHPYVKSYLSTHALLAQRLDPLLSQPGFLLAADQPQLLTALNTPDAVTSQVGRAHADAYRRASTALRSCSDYEQPSYLQLAARSGRAQSLAQSVDENYTRMPWRVTWAHWRLEHPHRTLIGHTSSVTSVAVASVRGRTLVASGAADGSVRVWDAATSELACTIDADPDYRVDSVAIAEAEGAIVVVGGCSDSAVRVWSSTSGALVRPPMQGHRDLVTAVGAGHVGGRPFVASSSRDGTVRLWDTRSGIDLIDPIRASNKPLLALAVGEISGRPFVTAGGDDRYVRAWDAASGDPLFDRAANHTRSITSLSVAQLNGQPVIVSGGQDRLIRLWDAATATSLSKPIEGTPGWVSAVGAGEFHGTSIVAAASDDIVRVWDLASGRAVGAAFTAHTDQVNGVAVGALDGRTVVASGSSDCSVRLWEVSPGEPVADPFTNRSGWVTSLSVRKLSGAAVVATGGSNNVVRLWDATDGTPLTDELLGHGGSIIGVSLGRVGERDAIASAGSDNTIRIWDAFTGKPMGAVLRLGQTITSMALGMILDRPFALTGGLDGAVRLHDLQSGAVDWKVLTGHDGPVSCVALGDLGHRTLLISGGHDRTVRAWDPVSGSPYQKPMRRHSGHITTVSLCRMDGRTYALSGSADRTAVFWDVTLGTEGIALRGHSETVTCSTLGIVDNELVAFTGSLDNTIRKWHPRRKSTKGEVFAVHSERITDVSLLSVDDGGVLASSSEDRTVQARDASSGRKIVESAGGQVGRLAGVVMCVSDSRILAVGASAKGTLHFWDAATGEECRQPLPAHARPIAALLTGVVKGRRAIITASQDRSLRCWDADTGESIGEPVFQSSEHTTSISSAPDEPEACLIIGGSDGSVGRLYLDRPRGQVEPITYHEASVLDVATAVRNGRQVAASASADGTAALWNVADGLPLGPPLVGHVGQVRSVDIHCAEGRVTVVSGGQDGTVRVWDGLSGRQLCQALPNHVGWVTCVRIVELQGRSSLISSGEDGRLMVHWFDPTGLGDDQVLLSLNPRVIDVGAAVSSFSIDQTGHLFAATDQGAVAVSLSKDGDATDWGL